jgi:hypothetical protein
MVRVQWKRGIMRESVRPDLRIKHLVRQVRLLSFLWLAVRILAASTTITQSRTLSVSGDETKVLRTRGIVIEDEKGTASPFFWGAPIPRTANGGRTSPTGLSCSKNGADRLVVGDAIPPQILGSVGKRSATEHSSGFCINDSTAMSAADTSRQVTMHC